VTFELNGQHVCTSQSDAQPTREALEAYAKANLKEWGSAGCRSKEEVVCPHDGIYAGYLEQTGLQCWPGNRIADVDCSEIVDRKWVLLPS
jgi:hypothetical protein